MMGIFSPFGFIVTEMENGMLDSLYMHSFRWYLSAVWHFLLIIRWGVVILQSVHKQYTDNNLYSVGQTSTVISHVLSTSH